MEKGDYVGRSKTTGEMLFFIAYSRMKYAGKHLLLCHTDKNASPQQCGQYTQEYFTK